MLQGQWAGLNPAPATITNWDTGGASDVTVQWFVTILTNTGCPIDLMKFVGTKSVQIPEGKVMIC